MAVPSSPVGMFRLTTGADVLGVRQTAPQRSIGRIDLELGNLSTNFLPYNLACIERLVCLRLSLPSKTLIIDIAFTVSTVMHRSS